MNLTAASFTKWVDTCMLHARNNSEFVLSRAEEETALLPIVDALIEMPVTAAIDIMRNASRGAGTYDALVVAMWRERISDALTTRSPPVPCPVNTTAMPSGRLKHTVYNAVTGTCMLDAASDAEFDRWYDGHAFYRKVRDTSEVNPAFRDLYESTKDLAGIYWLVND